MVDVINRNKTADYRIQIYDLKRNKTKTISLIDANEISLEKLKERILKCLGDINGRSKKNN